MKQKHIFIIVLLTLGVILSGCSPSKPALTATPAATPTPEIKAQHIVDLVKQGDITFNTTGGSINLLALNVQSHSGKPLRVDIPAGTYFVNADPASQNMVVRHAFTTLIQPHASVDINLDAACANLHLSEPKQGNTFTILRTPKQPELTRIIDKLNSAGVDYPIEQAAIWIVTDNATFDDLGLLVEGSRFGAAIINENDAVRAMLLVNQAGIDISKEAIWWESASLISKVTDPDLLAWLEDQKATAIAMASPTPAVVEIKEYAKMAAASSQFSTSGWSANQVVGSPDAKACDNDPLAWKSLNTTGKDWLLLTYDQAVIPSRILIYQSYQAGAVSQVEVLDEAGNGLPVYQAVPDNISTCPYTLEIEVTNVKKLVRSVRVTIDQTGHKGRNLIDAVQLIGLSR